MNRNIGFIFVIVSIFSSPFQAVGGNVVLRLNYAEADDCKSVCAKLNLDVYINNRFDHDLCMYARNVTDSVYQSLFVTTPTGVEPTYDVKAVFEDESHPDLAGMVANHIRMLQSEPQIFLPAHKALSYYVTTGDKYKLPRTPLFVHYQVYFYRCRGGGAYVRSIASTQIHFPPP